ncbi:Rod binding protein [Albimonas donghaensis]|uniref:Rod binding protein n=1 Tax=Albimonas donghaensis TaxID=356660 RepID=A0A1H2ZHY4_9RHOB|nr:rod-binding protein [Albimonas donghaensis]SDX17001.1 Rod binding protein [Albimonas donghaensis]
MTETTLVIPQAKAAPAPPPAYSGRDPARLQAAAEAFEAMFLAEMLTHAGLGQTPEMFGGGVGEDAFSGFLVREQANLMAAQGGIGLAESLVRALAARERVE